MVRFAFDDGTADRLIAAVRALADELGDQGIARSGAVEIAMTDFAGGYQKAFAEACRAESADRVRLAGVLWELADQVVGAKQAAGQERERRAELAAWELRDTERREGFARGDPFEQLAATTDSVFDPSPSEYAVTPGLISADFSSVERHRSALGPSGGTSSADPDKLRTFVLQSGGSNGRLAQHVSPLGKAWFAFLDACTYITLEGQSFLRGIDRYLNENAGDVEWIDRIARAFDAAGGSSSDRMLDLAWASGQPLTDQQVLDALATLPPDELAALFTASPSLRLRLLWMGPDTVNAWWLGLGPADGGEQFSERQHFLLTEFSTLFGNLEGIPYSARDLANQTTLDRETTRLELQLADMEALAGTDSLAGPSVPSPLAALRQNILNTKQQLKALRNIRKALLSPLAGDVRFLISLTDDRPPLGAVSIGDLDTASSVTYAVPGMGTTTNDMTGWSKAAQNLYNLLPDNSAVVAWIGYEPPPVPSAGDLDVGVLSSRKAIEGGNRLATALRGLTAVRGENVPQLNIVAHSYGTTTAAFALTHPDIRFDTFVTLGSAGLPDSVDKATDLNADRVFSGNARDKLPGERESGDQWAWVGRTGSSDHHVNPADDEFGSHVFGVETGGDAGRPVTDHNPLMRDKGDKAGYFDEKTESLQNAAWAIRGETDKMTAHAPLGPTDYQQSLFNGGSHRP